MDSRENERDTNTGSPVDDDDRTASRKALVFLGIVVVGVIYLIVVGTLFLAGHGIWAIVLTFILVLVAWGSLRNLIRRNEKPMTFEQDRLKGELETGRHDYLAAVDPNAPTGLMEAEMRRRQNTGVSATGPAQTSSSDEEQDDEEDLQPNIHEPIIERVDQGNPPADTIEGRQYPVILTDPALVFGGALFGLLLTIISEGRGDPAQYAIPWLFVACFLILIGVRYYESWRNRIKAVNEWRTGLSRIRVVGTIVAVILFVTAVWLFFANGHPIDLSGLVTVLSVIWGWITWICSIVFQSTVSFMLTLTVLAGIRFLYRFIDWYVNKIIVGPATLTKEEGIIFRGRPSIPIAVIANLQPLSVEIRIPFTGDKRMLKLPWVKLTFDSAAQHEPFVPRGHKGVPGEQINIIPFVPRYLANELEARYEYLKDPRQG